MTTNRCASWLTLAAVLLGADPLLAMAPQTVSPGFGDRVALVDQRCPTFSWGAVPGASFYELVVYALPEGSPGELELTPQTQVLGERVTGAACSFTPSGASLVFDGRYVWFLRAVLAEENGIVVDASEWSEGRYFALVAPVSFEQATSDTLRAPAGRGAGGEPAAAGDPVRPDDARVDDRRPGRLLDELARRLGGPLDAIEDLNDGQDHP